MEIRINIILLIVILFITLLIGLKWGIDFEVGETAEWRTNAQACFLGMQAYMDILKGIDTNYKGFADICEQRMYAIYLEEDP